MAGTETTQTLSDNWQPSRAVTPRGGLLSTIMNSLARDVSHLASSDLARSLIRLETYSNHHTH